ncbi:MAG: LysM peptidoglycan-binding domain-containing protein, partial [Anaerolineales bacterium]
MPMFTLSAPIIILGLIILLGLGAGFAYFALDLSGNIVVPTEAETPTITPLPSTTPTLTAPTATITPLPTPTPFTYVVKENDSCLAIAYLFSTSVQSIVVENGLAADCTDLSIGQELRVPQPTPKATPLASSTPGSQQATVEACEKAYHVVGQNETLSYISQLYEVPVETIMEWSGKSVDTAFYGETLTIPLCLRSAVAGATVTPSPAPEYPAPEL